VRRMGLSLLPRPHLCGVYEPDHPLPTMMDVEAELSGDDAHRHPVHGEMRAV
jgi:hypothetical protein